MAVVIGFDPLAGADTFEGIAGGFERLGEPVPVAIGQIQLVIQVGANSLAAMHLRELFGGIDHRRPDGIPARDIGDDDVLDAQRSIHMKVVAHPEPEQAEDITRRILDGHQPARPG
jgi:hypothetical protein